MIQAWKDLRFSAKLTLIFFLVLSLTIGVITIRQSYSSFRFLEEKSLEDMENLAEQVILNFTQTLGTEYSQTVRLRFSPPRPLPVVFETLCLSSFPKTSG